MRFQLPSGRVFTLSAHTPREWGLVLADRLRQLRCSEEYCQRVAAEYAAATKVEMA